MSGAVSFGVVAYHATEAARRANILDAMGVLSADEVRQAVLKIHTDGLRLSLDQVASALGLRIIPPAEDDAEIEALRSAARVNPALKHHLTMLAEYVDHPADPGDMEGLADDLLKSAGVLAQHLCDGAERERSWKGAAE